MAAPVEHHVDGFRLLLIEELHGYDAILLFEAKRIIQLPQKPRRQRQKYNRSDSFLFHVILLKLEIDKLLSVISRPVDAEYRHRSDKSQ